MNSVDELSSIDAERERRFRIWRQLLERYPDGRNVPPAFVRQLAIYGGMGQGVWMDKQATTGAIVAGGLAVGLNWANGYDGDGQGEDSFVYSYPRTKRAGRSDANEVQAVKNASRLQLPVFFIDAVTSPSTRQIRLAWVTEWDDEQAAFLLSFSRELTESRDAELPFRLEKASDDRRPSTIKSRPAQRLFRFHVLKRYGSRCAICSVRNPQLLDAAHLRPAESLGCDDARNGLVFCKTHHKALDARLITINPDTLEVEILESGESYESLKIDFRSIKGLRAKPHVDALNWLYSFRGSRAATT